MVIRILANTSSTGTWKPYSFGGTVNGSRAVRALVPRARGSDRPCQKNRTNEKRAGPVIWNQRLSLAFSKRCSTKKMNLCWPAKESGAEFRHSLVRRRSRTSGKSLKAEAQQHILSWKCVTKQMIPTIRRSSLAPFPLDSCPF